MEAEAAIASYGIGGRRHWGTHEQVQRLTDAERRLESDRAARSQLLGDDNRWLDAIVDELAEVLSARGIGVTSFRRMYPSVAVEAQPDHLVLTTDDLAAANWLLENSVMQNE